MSDIRKECIEWMKVTPSNKRDNYPDEYKKFLNCCKNMWYDNPQDMLKWVEGVWERKKRNKIFNRDPELAYKVIHYAYSKCDSIDARTAPFIINQKTDTIYVRRQEGGDTWLLDEINSMLPEDCKKFSEGSGFGLKDNSGREFEHNFVKFLWCLVRGEDCNLINENLKSNFKSTFMDIINSIQYEEEG